jgi:hypothetical protein
MAKDSALVARKRPDRDSFGTLPWVLVPWGGARSLQALLVASCLVASMNATGEELGREQVTLSMEALPRAEALSPHMEDWREGVLSLRVMDPGRLVVRVGAEVIAASALGWGEDQRLRVDRTHSRPGRSRPCPGWPTASQVGRRWRSTSR